MYSPSWPVGLCRSGTYYEGWVGDLDEVLQLHSQESVTCYGTQRSAKASGSTAEVKQCEDEHSVVEKVCCVINHEKCSPCSWKKKNQTNKNKIWPILEKLMLIALICILDQLMDIV